MESDGEVVLGHETAGWVERSVYELQTVQARACAFPHMKTSSIQNMRRVLRRTGNYDIYCPREGMGVGDFCMGAMIARVTSKKASRVRKETHEEE